MSSAGNNYIGDSVFPDVSGKPVMLAYFLINCAPSVKIKFIYSQIYRIAIKVFSLRWWFFVCLFVVVVSMQYGDLACPKQGQGTQVPFHSCSKESPVTKLKWQSSEVAFRDQEEIEQISISFNESIGRHFLPCNRLIAWKVPFLHLTFY